MRTFCDWVRTGKPISLTPSYTLTPDPSPDVIAKRPYLSPSVGTSYPTDEHLSARQDWMAHIAAGRISVGQGRANSGPREANVMGGSLLVHWHPGVFWLPLLDGAGWTGQSARPGDSTGWGGIPGRVGIGRGRGVLWAQWKTLASNPHISFSR